MLKESTWVEGRKVMMLRCLKKKNQNKDYFEFHFNLNPSLTKSFIVIFFFFDKNGLKIIRKKNNGKFYVLNFIL